MLSSQLEYGDLIAMPDSPDGWRAVARVFNSRWNFHHCVGAVDGKHIRIVKPNSTGSQYHNYKRVLLRYIVCNSWSGLPLYVR